VSFTKIGAETQANLLKLLEILAKGMLDREMLDREKEKRKGRKEEEIKL
jgi:hypothetical protein